MGKIRWGILGTGRISSDFTNALKTLEEAEIVAVGSRSIESAQKYAKAFGVPKAYGSYEELVADPEVDVIYVSTVVGCHYENIVLCIQNKKHVVCEKTFTVNAKQTNEIISLAKEHDVFVMEALWTRYFPIYHKFFEILERGDIGTINTVHSDIGFNGSEVGNLQNPHLGGGSLFAAGVYPLSLISFAYSTARKARRPSKIQAYGRVTPSGVDSHVSGVLEYSPGEVATFSSSISSNIGGSFKVSGTKGRIEIPAPCWCPDTMFVIDETGKETKYHYPYPESKAKYNFTNSQALAYEAKAAMDYIKSGFKESPLWGLESTLIVIETMDTIRNQLGLKYPNE